MQSQYYLVKQNIKSDTRPQFIMNEKHALNASFRISLLSPTYLSTIAPKRLQRQITTHQNYYSFYDR